MPAKKQGLAWKSRLMLFKVQRGIQEKAKAILDICQAGCGENKLDSLPSD